MDNIVYFNYTNPLHSTAYGSINTVSKFYKPDVSLERVKSILSHHKVYTLKRLGKRVKNHVPIYAYFKRDLLQLDLIDVAYMSHFNKGVHFLLNVYDTASKYVWIFPLKKKTGKIVSEQLDIFFTNLNPPAKRILLDRGTEFTNSLSMNVFLKHNIKITHPKKGKHAFGVERSNRQIQALIYKGLLSTGKKRYIDDLDYLVDLYNSRHHRIIKMSPKEAEKDQNSNLLALTLLKYYGKNALKGRKQHKKSKLFVNDFVRVKLERKTFTRGYQDHYSKTLYQINAIDISKHIPLYILSSIEDKNELLPRKYYEEELLKVDGTIDKSLLKKIPPYSILQERKNKNGKTEVLIQWNDENISNKYNTWVYKDYLLTKNILKDEEN